MTVFDGTEESRSCRIIDVDLEVVDESKVFVVEIVLHAAKRWHLLPLPFRSQGHYFGACVQDTM